VRVHPRRRVEKDRITTAREIKMTPAKIVDIGFSRIALLDRVSGVICHFGAAHVLGNITLRRD
jgi:hypothetical protein